MSKKTAKQDKNVLVAQVSIKVANPKPSVAYAVFEHAIVGKDARLHGVRKNREDALELARQVVNEAKGNVGYIAILTQKVK